MPEGSVITEEMRKAIGVESPAGPETEIEKGHIRRFAEAIGDSNILFTDEEKARNTTKYGGIIAPPTFFRSCTGGGGGQRIDVRAITGLTRALDGGSDWEYFEPVRPGDRISVTTKIVDFQERDGRMGKMLITYNQSTYRNQFGKVVATQTTSGILY